MELIFDDEICKEFIKKMTNLPNNLHDADKIIDDFVTMYDTDQWDKSRFKTMIACIIDECKGGTK